MSSPITTTLHEFTLAVMVNKTHLSKDAMQCTTDLVTLVSRRCEERKAAELLPSEADLMKYSVLCSFTDMIGQGVHRKTVEIRTLNNECCAAPCHLAHALTCVEYMCRLKILHMHTCMEYMSWVKECSIHAIRGLVNHGPLLGWAIQQGHTIAWSEAHKNYLPSIQGTPQEKPSTTIALLSYYHCNRAIATSITLANVNDSQP